MGGNTCEQFDQQGINLQNLLKAHVAQYEETAQSKWAKYLNRRFSQQDK